jgi:hypothetical protein
MNFDYDDEPGLPPQPNVSAPAEDAPIGGDEASLQRRSCAARDDLAESMGDLKESLGDVVNPAEWAKSHPWWIVGASLATGFAVTSAVLPGGWSAFKTRLLRLLEWQLPLPTSGTAGAMPARPARRTVLLRDLVIELAEAVVLRLVLRFAEGTTASQQAAHAASPAAAEGAKPGDPPADAE